MTSFNGDVLINKNADPEQLSSDLEKLKEMRQKQIDQKN